MAGICVFAPLAINKDDPLYQTRWIADVTIEALKSQDCDVIALLDEKATRFHLQTALSGSKPIGLCVFSHGRSLPERYVSKALDSKERKPTPTPAILDDAVIGSDKEPALDRDNIEILESRWVHAMACRLGNKLAPAAITHGSECFAAYLPALIVDWSPEEIPEDRISVVKNLVLSTTLLLNNGVRKENDLKAAILRIQDSLLEWIDEDDDAPAYLPVFAGQLADVVLFTHNGNH